MTKGAKILIVLAVAGLFCLINASFVVTDLNDRALILGVGIDYLPEEKLFEVTAEIIVAQSSGDSESSSGGGEKLLAGKGKTVSLAFRNLYNTFGKTPSFGECNILVMGQKCMETQNVSNTLRFFVDSDAFKDGTLVSACEGSAKDLFGKKSQVDDYISFALQTLLVQSGKKAQIPNSNLNDIIHGQLSVSSSGFVNYVKFIPKEEQESGGSTTQPSQPNKEGKFVTSQLAVFSNGNFAGLLSREEVDGFNLYSGKNIFTTFFLDTQEPIAVGIVSKSGGGESTLKNDDTVQLNIELKLRLMELLTDTTGEVLPFQPQTSTQLSSQQTKAAEDLAKKYIESTLKKCAELNCDILEIKRNLYASYGKKFLEFEKKHGDDFWERLNYTIKITAIG